MNTKGRSESVFVVRMWREPSAFGQSGWRGSLEDVLSKKNVYFSDVISLPSLIAERLKGESLTAEPARHAEAGPAESDALDNPP